MMASNGNGNYTYSSSPEVDVSISIEDPEGLPVPTSMWPGDSNSPLNCHASYSGTLPSRTPSPGASLFTTSSIPTAAFMHRVCSMSTPPRTPKRGRRIYPNPPPTTSGMGLNIPSIPRSTSPPPMQSSPMIVISSVDDAAPQPSPSGRGLNRSSNHVNSRYLTVDYPIDQLNSKATAAGSW
jgi:hypothetical protein